MQGDLSRHSHDPAKRFTAVRFEQGRMLADADLNEAMLLALARLDRVASDLVGPSGAPAEPPVPFTWQPSALDPQQVGVGAILTTGTAVIGRGTSFFAAGIAAGARLHAGGQTRTVATVLTETVLLVDEPFEPDLPAAGNFQITVRDGGAGLQVHAGCYSVAGLRCELAATVALSAQPDLPGYALPSADGRYLAYLEAWERTLSTLAEPLLAEPALLGPDTCLRTRVVAQVKLLAVGATATCGGFAAWEPLPPAVQLAARSLGRPPADRLYRVEVQAPGPPGTATFKWARDNASAAAPIEALGPGEITVAPPIGLAGEAAFAAGQWVEVSDERRILAGEPGVLVQLARVVGQVLSVESWPGGTPPLLGAGASARRWDSPGEVSVEVGEAGDLWLSIEGGLEVRFAAAAAASCAVGDAWLLPVRVASGGVLWPQLAGTPLAVDPQSPRHRFAPLAIVERSGGRFRVVSDCRRLFGSLADPPSDTKLDRVPDPPPAGPDLMEGPLVIASDLAVLGGLSVGSVDPPAPDLRLEVTNGDLLLAAGGSAGVVWPPLASGGAAGFLRFSQVAGATPQLTLGSQGGGSDRLILRQGGVDRLVIDNGRLGVGTVPAAGFALDVAGTMRAQNLRIEGPVVIAGGAPSPGALFITDDAGRGSWVQPPVLARGRPLFFPAPVAVASGVGAAPETIFTFPAGVLSPGALAVILEAEAAANTGDGVIQIATDPGGTKRLLLRARSEGSGDSLAWAGQGAFPLNQESFVYEVLEITANDGPAFSHGWVLRAIGYYP